MWWQQREAEGEVWAGEDGESLDEDVGNGLVAGKVRIELVAAQIWSVAMLADYAVRVTVSGGAAIQIELIIELQWEEGFSLRSLG